MAAPYRIGIMRAPVESTNDEVFAERIDRAVVEVRELLTDELGLDAAVFEFTGPHMSPSGGTYSPLDFLQIGMTERLERDLHFLLVVTEVDLSPSQRSYVLALPSQTTNVGILSAKRLDPEFWGDEPDEVALTRRLAALMMHTLGHLLGLRHHPESDNVMHDFETLEDLEAMRNITPEQIGAAMRVLPEETSERVAIEDKVRFALRQIWANRTSIAASVRRANPFRLLTRMPTMATAALSVMIVLFFSTEMWDVGSSVAPGPLIVFSLLAIVVGTALLYRSFRLGGQHIRRRGLAESTVVTAAATLISLTLAIVVFYAVAFAASFLSAITFFPEALKESWPTVDPAARLGEQANLSLFLAAMAVLSGSLGGSADSKRVIRYVLFLDEET